MGSSDTFDQRRAAYRARVNNALEECLPNAAITPRRLHAAMREAVLRGGKRLRPLLCYAAAEATRVPASLVDAPAIAVELIHCYSLVHDDMPCMDDDDFRRGRPSIHKAYGEDTALLTGDALQTLAWKVLATHPSLEDRDPARACLVGMLADCSGSTGMAGGQELDLRGGPTPDMAEIEHAYRTKTGGLFRAAALSPACVNPRLPTGARHALEAYADALGLAFQIRDDLADLSSDTRARPASSGSRLPSWVDRFGVAAARDRLEELLDRMTAACSGFGAEGEGLQWLADFIRGALTPPESTATMEHSARER